MPRPSLLTISMCFVVLCFVLGSLPIAEALAKQPDHTKKRLEAGEIIVKTTPVRGSSFPRIKAFGVIEASPAEVWKRISACAVLARTMLFVEKTRTLSKRGATERCEMTVSLPLGMGRLRAVADAINKVVPDKKYERSWTFVEGDYTAYAGQWTLVPWGNDARRTLAVYEQHVAASLPIPDGMQRAGQLRNVPEIIQKLRGHVN